MRSRASRSFLAPLLIGALLLAGCSSAEPDGAPAADVVRDSAENGATADVGTDPFDDDARYAAAALKSVVSAHDAPGGAVVSTFSNPQASGAPLNFLVKDHDGEWLEVYLPMRPNGATGWVLASAVEVRELPYRLVVSTSENVMRMFEHGELVREFSVATGTGGTPTPLGTFYLTELMAPTNAGYGPFAYGLSAYSEVLNDFGGGPGQIGLHGTDDAASIGTAASHGCIRLANDDITALAEILPLGTPITIRE